MVWVNFALILVIIYFLCGVYFSGLWKWKEADEKVRGRLEDEIKRLNESIEKDIQRLVRLTGIADSDFEEIRKGDEVKATLLENLFGDEFVEEGIFQGYNRWDGNVKLMQNTGFVEGTTHPHYEERLYSRVYKIEKVEEKEGEDKV